MLKMCQWNFVLLLLAVNGATSLVSFGCLERYRVTLGRMNFNLKAQLRKL